MWPIGLVRGLIYICWFTANGSDVQVSGCLYDTYNACVNVNRVAALTYMCRYCDTADGCNGDVQSASGRQVMVTLVLSSVAAVLAVMPLI